jgi:hypothetical protein
LLQLAQQPDRSALYEPDRRYHQGPRLLIRLDFTYKFGQVGPLDLDLKFGGFFSQRIKEDDNYQSANGCGYCNNFSQTLGAVGVNAIVPWPYGSGFQIGGVGSNGTWQTLSAQQLFAAAIATSGQAYFDSTIAAQFTPLLPVMSGKECLAVMFRPVSRE